MMVQLVILALIATYFLPVTTDMQHILRVTADMKFWCPIQQCSQ